MLASGLAPITATASQLSSEPAKIAPAGSPARTSASPVSPVQRLYLVKNENGYMNALRDDELDAPAKLTRLGNAKKVSYHGHTVGVEATIVTQGKRTSTISTDTAVGDSDDD